MDWRAGGLYQNPLSLFNALLASKNDRISKVLPPMHFMPVTPEKPKAPRMHSYNHGTNFLATWEMHYVVNPKHDQLIGTILLFATKKAKQQRVD